MLFTDVVGKLHLFGLGLPLFIGGCAGGGGEPVFAPVPAGGYTGTFAANGDPWQGTLSVAVANDGTLTGTAEDNYRGVSQVHGSAVRGGLALTFVYPGTEPPEGRGMSGPLSRGETGFHGSLYWNRGDGGNDVQVVLTPRAP
jgi:hypothetical protein